MAESSEKERGTFDRGKGGTTERKVVLLTKEPHTLIVESTKDSKYGRVKVPRKVLVLDEVAITPTKTRQPKKQAQRKLEEVRSTAPANRGRDDSKAESAGEPVVSGAPGEEFSTTEEEWDALVSDLSVELSQARSRAIADRFARGEQVSVREARRPAERLVAEARQRALLAGKETQGVGEAIRTVGEIMRSVLEKEAKSAEDAAKKGIRTGEGYGTFAQQSALGMERQAQLMGGDSLGGVEVAKRFGELQRSELNKKIVDVLKSAEHGERSGPAYVEHLMAFAFGSERQTQLLGEETSEGMFDMAMALKDVPFLSLEEEARDVVAGSEKGQRFDDSYIEHLEKRLRGDRGPGGSEAQRRELAGSLRKLRRSMLVDEIKQVRPRADKDEGLYESYLAVLKQRLVEFDSQNSGGSEP